MERLWFGVWSGGEENWRVSRLSKEQEQEKLEMMENDTLQRLLLRHGKENSFLKLDNGFSRKVFCPTKEFFLLRPVLSKLARKLQDFSQHFSFVF